MMDEFISELADELEQIVQQAVVGIELLTSVIQLRREMDQWESNA